MAASATFNMPDIGGGTKIVSGDFNGDGKPDLFVINYDWPTGTRPSTWALLLGNGSGSYTVAQNVATSDYSFPGKILVADFNGDRIDDIFVGTYGNENLQTGAPDLLLLGGKSGQLTESRDLAGIRTWAHGSSLGDLDNDGDIDILNAGIGNLPSSVWLNDAKADFTLSAATLPTVFPYFQTANVWSTHIADINGDGRNDIVIGHSGGEYALKPYGYSGTGAPAMVFYATAAGGWTGAALPTGKFGVINTDTVSIASADFDGDGRVDLLLSNYDKGAFLENGKVVYTGDANAGAGAGSMTVDGYTLTRAGMDNREMQLLLNKPAGWVDASAQLGSGNEPTLNYLSSVRAIDLDGDGDLDIAGTVAGQLTLASTGPVAWLNDGAGRFSAIKAYPFPAGQASSVYEWTYADVSGAGDWRMVAVFATDATWPQKAVFISDPLVARQGIGGSAGDDMLVSSAAVTTPVFAHGGNDTVRLGGLSARAELGSGDDVIFAGSGNATIVGGAGNDQIDGGDGIDTAVYLGKKANYVVSKTAGGFVVTDRTGTDGRDSLVNIEKLLFADGTVDLTIAAPKVDVAKLAATIVPAHPVLAGTAPASATVYLYNGATSLGSVQANASGAWTFDAGTLNGNYSLSADVVDKDGNVSVRSGLLNYVQVAGAATLPVGGNSLAVGSAGRDTVAFAGQLAGYKVARGEGCYTVTDTLTGDVTALVNIERVRFDSGAVAFDVDGVAGQAYRVYQAAFNRTPDPGGLGYWIASMDNGSSLLGVASGFVTSLEFRAMYGANPTSRQLVERFYENVLHRPGEAAGVEWWVGLLDQHQISLSDLLVGFSESAENKAALIGVMQNGIGYTPFG